MQKLHALVQRNIHRASFSLPFLDPALRDFIGLIPSLLAEGKPSIGIYEHPTCSRKDFVLLGKYLGRTPDIIVGRLPYQVMLDSVIALVRPSLSNRYRSTVTLVCLARKDAYDFDLEAKLFLISAVCKQNGIAFAYRVFKDTLPQLLVYEIMRTGIVVGGKSPVTQKDSGSDSSIYIGELSGNITDTERVASGEWNVFEGYLDSQVDRFISENNYPSALSLPSVNPYILPYLHILHHFEEQADAEEIEKMQVCLGYLFREFPPTAESTRNLGRRHNAAERSLSTLSFAECMRLRKWLVPPEKNELPVFSWPAAGRYALEEAELTERDDLWGIKGVPELKHAYPWVVLTWAALAGLIYPTTRITAPKRLGLKQKCGDILLDAVEAMKNGADILVPGDHQQGSIQMIQGRFFFSPKPFAIFEKGRKHSINLFEAIKKKTMIDDIDLNSSGMKGR